MHIHQDTVANRDFFVPAPVLNEIGRVVQEMVVQPIVAQNTAIDQLLANHANWMEKSNQEIARLRSQIMTLEGRARHHDEGVARLDTDSSNVENILLVPEPPIPEPTRNRQRAPKRDVISSLPHGALWSRDLLKAREYWLEYTVGINEQPSLKSQEDKGKKWRSDTQIETKNGKRSIVLEQNWSYRTKIYNWVHYRIDYCDLNEDQALEEVQQVFNPHVSPRGRPKLQDIAKELSEMLRSAGGVARHGRL